MNHSDQHNEIPVAYPHPQPIEGYPPPQVVAPPPPLGYPTKDAQDNISLQNPHVVETQSRGDDFWKGCFAALCCCCVLDFCF